MGDINKCEKVKAHRVNISFELEEVECEEKANVYMALREFGIWKVGDTIKVSPGGNRHIFPYPRGNGMYILDHDDEIRNGRIKYVETINTKWTEHVVRHDLHTLADQIAHVSGRSSYERMRYVEDLLKDWLQDNLSDRVRRQVRGGAIKL